MKTIKNDYMRAWGGFVAFLSVMMPGGASGP